MTKQKAISEGLTFEEFKAEVLADYRLANESRQASLVGRKEVLTGKAKFGIFGDGKEIAQIALAKVFKNGDFRSGYYRDQTFMFAIGELTIQQFFAQLYAHTDVAQEPASAGRLMNGHYGSRLINPDGTWRKQTAGKNSSSDISPTAGQMPRHCWGWHGLPNYTGITQHCINPQIFSVNGNEVALWNDRRCEVLPKGLSGKPLMLLVFCRCQWRFPCGMTGMEFRYPINTRLPSKAFQMPCVALSATKKEKAI